MCQFNEHQLGISLSNTFFIQLLDNDSLEELHVAENTSTALKKSLPRTPMLHCSSPTYENPKPNSNREETTNCVTNSKFDNLEVADSEDDEPGINTSIGNTNKNNNNLSKSDASCASSCHEGPHASSQVVQELCDAIVCAKQLKMIDLSRNGFENDAVELLYSAWGLGSGLRGDVLTCKHIAKDCIHFYVDGVMCCGVKPCCRRE